MLRERNPVVVERLDHRFDAGRKVGVATLEVRVLAALKRRAKALLGLDECAAYLLAWL
jgi:hypothetical protein